MKNFIFLPSIIILSLMFIPLVSFAQGTQNGVHEAGTGLKNPELKETKQGSSQGKQEQNSQGRGGNNASDMATQRRSKVSNAVQEMLQVAERNQGVGKQIRTIAQNQNQNQSEIESTLENVKNRGRLKKFFFGPNYKYLNLAEGKLATHEEKLAELKELASKITNEEDRQILEEQIAVMEEVSKELGEEIVAQGKGFSLFGWLNKILSK
ncbi:hypothetical protein C0583_00480 [Candidatus Parcubacteria bacterium]|nr:MAG: hypothetical protein C0583_00480 [Candidatus Parcubacteria bacterium]